jgi:hypothetical protein
LRTAAYDYHFASNNGVLWPALQPVFAPELKTWSARGVAPVFDGAIDDYSRECIAISIERRRNRGSMPETTRADLFLQHSPPDCV